MKNILKNMNNNFKKPKLWQQKNWDKATQIPEKVIQHKL